MLTTPLTIGGEILNKIPGFYPRKSIAEIVRLMYWLLPVFGIVSIWDFAVLQRTLISIWDFAVLQRTIISFWDFAEFFVSNGDFVSNWDFVGIRDFASNWDFVSNWDFFSN